jgi:hypothetical protein
MSHAHDQMWERYGFIVHPHALTTIIREGRAKELFEFSESTRGGCRIFDVPVPFNDGSQKIVRCLVSPNLRTLVTVLPLRNSKPSYKHYQKTTGADNKRVHKTVTRRLVDDEEEEVVTPYGVFKPSDIASR